MHLSAYWRVAFVLLAAGWLFGCGGTDEYAIVGTARAAGADGTVEVEEIEGGNRLVTVAMSHLPPPERLGEGMTTYVVWFVPKGQQAIKAGSLGYDPDTREGRMMATSPQAGKFTVRVTAERNVNAGTPSEVVVAQREVKGAD